MTAGCCNATKVAIIQVLKQRYFAEMNPDVRRGLLIAIIEIKREG